MSTSGGTAAGTIKYFPFGSTRSTSGTIDTDKKFTGQRLDDTGLYYYNARYYDPEIGRFISADIIIQDFRNPQFLNRYSYCLNNPLKYTDPSGRIIPVLAIVGILVLATNVAAVSYDLYQYNVNPSNENAIYALADLIDPNPVPTRIWTGWAKQAWKAIVKGPTFYKKAGVWLLDSFSRGQEIERRLGGMGNNFPTIDKFVQRPGCVADSVTSIKSIDITSTTYNKGDNLFNKVKGYIDALRDFETSYYGGTTVYVDKNTKKILQLALPPTPFTSEQSKQMEQV